MSDWNVFVNALVTALLTIVPLVASVVAFIYFIFKVSELLDEGASSVSAAISTFAVIAVIATAIAWIVVLYGDDGFRKEHLPLSKEDLAGEGCTYYGDYIVDCDQEELDPYYVEIESEQ